MDADEGARKVVIRSNMDLILKEVYKGKYSRFKVDNVTRDTAPYLSQEKLTLFCKEMGLEYELLEKRAEEMIEEEVLERQYLKIDEKRHIYTKLFNRINKILKKYLDLNEDYYHIISLWIMGTYVHKSFVTYPYLFFNAMKGSGKTRLLKLLATLSKNGQIHASITESILFRSANNTTLCLDELESINSRDKNALRELLNIAYKQGAKVKRLRKVKSEKEEKYVVDEFDVYVPVAIANISGLGDVLSNRCITMILEKSKSHQTMLLEIFDIDPDIISVLKIIQSKDIWTFMDIKTAGGVYTRGFWSLWNRYILGKYRPPVPNIYNVLICPNVYKLIKDIANTELYARELEIFFPLMVLSTFCEKEVMDTTIAVCKRMVRDRIDEEVIESKDISFLEFIAKKGYSDVELTSIETISKDFNDFLGRTGGKYEITNHWVGKALRRLNLVLRDDKMGKKRDRRGAVINTKKAIQKIKMYGIDVSQTTLEVPKETEVESISEWDDKALVWLNCDYPKGDSICGDSPCNEHDGLNYCKKHFEVVVK